MIGTVLAGRYRVTGLLGGGGMAVVYKATDQVTGETVAVKALRAEYVADGAFLRRLRREAEAVRRLSHPGVVAVRDVGEDGGHPFLVLEYVDGITLKQYIREKAPLPPAEAAGIACRVLAVLEHAHQHGVIHRDVKPQNILITPDARVMVTDFGIARASGTTTTVVDQGAMVGTAQYFAPEQAKGMPATERSDLYAVGVILFEMLTGRLPFDGDSPVAVAMQHLGQQPPLPSALNPAVPRALEAIVLKALEKNPDCRYPSAAAMRADLERFLAGRPVTALARQAVQDTLVAGPPRGAGSRGGRPPDRRGPRGGLDGSRVARAGRTSTAARAPRRRRKAARGGAPPAAPTPGPAAPARGTAVARAGATAAQGAGTAATPRACAPAPAPVLAPSTRGPGTAAGMGWQAAGGRKRRRVAGRRAPCAAAPARMRRGPRSQRPTEPPGSRRPSPGAQPPGRHGQRPARGRGWPAQVPRPPARGRDGPRGGAAVCARRPGPAREPAPAAVRRPAPRGGRERACGRRGRWPTGRPRIPVPDPGPVSPLPGLPRASEPRSPQGPAPAGAGPCAWRWPCSFCWPGPWSRGRRSAAGCSRRWSRCPRWRACP
ncbi:serine/threonine protein kinase [Thermaerobacter sp. FW80]|uniref:protein kinase domain-containing protein n=1 Tax=Thermaerobacter sp. FW80 TaxID=2546351 RepID=UPI001075254C|nr:protein kinase [Thermaerobacter sp. FW80]QBS37772.1 serine/threonine protein kinase [Thermaerobacter sp. FW80]